MKKINILCFLILCLHNNVISKFNLDKFVFRSLAVFLGYNFWQYYSEKKQKMEKITSINEFIQDVSLENKNKILGGIEFLYDQHNNKIYNNKSTSINKIRKKLKNILSTTLNEYNKDIIKQFIIKKTIDKYHNPEFTNYVKTILNDL